MSPILIGTSGYDHPELKGSFYPLDLPRKKFLEYYSTQFNSLEINSSFYGMPTPERILNFYNRTQGQLKFSIKLNRLLTHEIDKNWIDNTNLFKKAIAPLYEKAVLASVLIQFPENFDYTIENRQYLASLIHELSPFPCVVEFRNKNWIRKSVFDGLASRNTGIVFCDMPQCASPFSELQTKLDLQTPFIGTQTYIRMHGRNETGWYAKNNPGQETKRYDYEYTQAELISFIPIIKKAQKEGRQIQLYFNNHPKGIGFKNALQLMELLKIQKPQFSPSQPDLFSPEHFC